MTNVLVQGFGLGVGMAMISGQVLQALGFRALWVWEVTLTNRGTLSSSAWKGLAREG